MNGEFNHKSHKSFFFLKFELTRFKVQKRELRNFFVDFNALLLIFLRHLSFVTNFFQPQKSQKFFLFEGGTYTF